MNVYNGRALYDVEYRFICDLEELIEEEIPHLDSKNHVSEEEFGFRDLNGYLRELYVPYKGLNSIPESIGDLENLRVLELHENNIDILPDSLGRLINLDLFSIYGNPIKAPVTMNKEEHTYQIIFACGLDVFTAFINQDDFNSHFKQILEIGFPVDDPLCFMEHFHDKFYEERDYTIDKTNQGIKGALDRLFLTCEGASALDEIFEGDFYRVKDLYEELREEF